MLSVDGVSFRYDHMPVLESISFRIEKGELCAILGNNGAGKSTLLKCLLGILRPQKGTVLVSGHDVARLSRMEKARHMSYVAQRETGGSRVTVFDTVLMGRRPHIGLGAGPEDLNVVQDVIETLGLEGLSLRCVDELSGGELQKVLIARALAQEPGIMLLDEPTSNLDLKNQLEVMETVRRAVARGDIAALMAIHDVNLALRFSHKFMLLRKRSILAFGGSEIIAPETMRKVYGVEVYIETVGGRKIVVPLGDAGGPPNGGGAGDREDML